MSTFTRAFAKPGRRNRRGSALPVAVHEEQQAEPEGVADEILALQKTIGNAAVSRVLAREAVVPLPGAGTQIIGDDDSDVTFAPWAKFEASNAPADVAYGRVAGLQSGGFQSTDMPDDGGYAGTLSIKAGSKGSVRLMV